MSLWTPYEPDQALDLTKSAKRVKKEIICSPIRENPPAFISSPDYHLSPSLYSQRYHPCYQEESPSPPQLVPGRYEMPRMSPPASSPVSESERVRKIPRPFKAVTAALPEFGAAVDPDPNYAAFRAAMLEAMRARNGGSLTVSNPRMRRSVRRNSEAESGAEYLERRARNNFAAKRSRDLRKQKEDELAIRAAYLERLNAELRVQIAAANRCLNCQAIC